MFVVDVFAADQNAAAGSQLRFLNGPKATDSHAYSDGSERKQPGLAAGLLLKTMENPKALSNDSDPP